MRALLFLCFILCSCFLFAHEGHEGHEGYVGHEGHEGYEEKKVTAVENIHENVQKKVAEAAPEGRSTTWIQWIGSFHLIFVHFPIALINMLAISELLLIRYKEPIFEYSSRFLLISVAILAPPTALLGLIYSYSAPYEGLMAIFLWWHMCFGILTAILAITAAIIRQRKGLTQPYYACLLLLFIAVNAAGYFGGEMTFG